MDVKRNGSGLLKVAIQEFAWGRGDVSNRAPRKWAKECNIHYCEMVGERSDRDLLRGHRIWTQSRPIVQCIPDAD